MVLTFFLVLFSALLLYLCFMPIVLVIDTRADQYYLQLKGLLTASVLADEKEVLKVHLKLLLFNFDFYPLRPGTTPKPKGKELSSPKKKKRPLLKVQTILRLLRSFKMKSFYLNLDTGNCITNAKLYPVFALLNFYQGGFHINFTGQNTLVLVIENKPVRLIKAFINV